MTYENRVATSCFLNEIQHDIECFGEVVASAETVDGRGNPDWLGREVLFCNDW